MKKNYSFRLSDEAIARLAQLCSDNGLTQGAMVEHLILGTGATNQVVVKREIAHSFNDPGRQIRKAARRERRADLQTEGSRR